MISTSRGLLVHWHARLTGIQTTFAYLKLFIYMDRIRSDEPHYLIAGIAHIVRVGPRVLPSYPDILHQSLELSWISGESTRELIATTTYIPRQYRLLGLDLLEGPVALPPSTLHAYHLASEFHLGMSVCTRVSPRP